MVFHYVVWSLIEILRLPFFCHLCLATKQNCQNVNLTRRICLCKSNILSNLISYARSFWNCTPWCVLLLMLLLTHVPFHQQKVKSCLWQCLKKCKAFPVWKKPILYCPYLSPNMNEMIEIRQSISLLQSFTAANLFIPLPEKYCFLDLIILFS